MEPYKKRLHLDKTEVAFLLGLGFLISSLMFCFGLLLGFGLKNGNPQTAHVAEVKNAHTKADSHSEKKSSRAPASEETEKTPDSAQEKIAAPVPGAKLREDFKESKQRSLVEMNLRSPDAVQPKSLVDAKAHFAAHSEWSRNPASEKTKDKIKFSEQKNPKNKIAKEEEAKDLPQGVKTLFERKPSSLDVFTPIPGTYTVQIASYATADEATAKVIDLRKNKFNEAYMQNVKLKNGETWYRVSVGGAPSPVWAKKTGERLVKQKLAGDFVIRKIASE